MSSLSLDDSIQSLPQELQGKILNCVLELSCPFEEDGIDIDRTYKPPRQLQLNRQLRWEFAKAYFSRTFALPASTFRDIQLVESWLRATEQCHRQQIRKFRLDKDLRDSQSALSMIWLKMEEKRWISALEEQLGAIGGVLELGIIHFRRLPLHDSRSYTVLTL